MKISVAAFRRMKVYLDTNVLVPATFTAVKGNTTKYIMMHVRVQCFLMSLE